MAKRPKSRTLSLIKRMAAKNPLKGEANKRAQERMIRDFLATPEGALTHLSFWVGHVKDELLEKDVREGKATTAENFIRLGRQMFLLMEASADIRAVAGTAVLAGQAFDEWKHKDLADAKRYLLKKAKEGGAARKLGIDDDRNNLAKWDRLLTGRKRIKATFEKLCIPMSTYYETQIRVKEFDSGT